MIEKLMADLPQLDKDRIDDLIVGNAMPEAEQGLNVARLISLMGLNTDKVPGVTVNRYCASGSEAIAIASAKIQAGMADCIIAGGAESMSFIPMGGYKPVPESHYANLTQIIIGEWVTLQKKWLSNIKLQEKNKTNLLLNLIKSFESYC